eukprot:gene19414-26071_t
MQASKKSATNLSIVRFSMPALADIIPTKQVGLFAMPWANATDTNECWKSSTARSRGSTVGQNTEARLILMGRGAGTNPTVLSLSAEAAPVSTLLRAKAKPLLIPLSAEASPTAMLLRTEAKPILLPLSAMRLRSEAKPILLPLSPEASPTAMLLGTEAKPLLLPTSAEDSATAMLLGTEAKPILLPCA